jgi:hypothetical protein
MLVRSVIRAGERGNVVSIEGRDKMIDELRISESNEAYSLAP